MLCSCIRTSPPWPVTHLLQHPFLVLRMAAMVGAGRFAGARGASAGRL
jgi:hypothetical protein